MDMEDVSVWLNRRKCEVVFASIEEIRCNTTAVVNSTTLSSGSSSSSKVAVSRADHEALAAGASSHAIENLHLVQQVGDWRVIPSDHAAGGSYRLPVRT